MVRIEIYESQDQPIVLEVNWYPWINAQNALELAYHEITFGLQFYGYNLGYLVTMINKIYDAPGSGYYWEFFHNGKSSNSGVDSTVLNDGDTISFKNVKYSAQIHTETLLEVKHREANKAKA